MIFSSPEAEEDFIEKGNLEILMNDYEPSELSKTASKKAPPRIFKDAEVKDILIGRYVSHPGNILARKVIMRNRDYFRSLPNSEERKVATDCMIAFFENNGCRFLEPVSKFATNFRPAPYTAVMEKIRKSLRETGIRSDRKPPPKVSFRKSIVPNKKSNVSKIVSKPAPTKVKKKAKVDKPVAKKSDRAPILEHPHSEPEPLQDVDEQSACEGSIHESQTIYPGDRLAILWPEDGVYYPGTVLKASGTMVDLLYDDDEKETLDLSCDRYVLLGKTPKDPPVNTSERQSLPPSSFVRRVSLSSEVSSSPRTSPVNDASPRTTPTHTFVAKQSCGREEAGPVVSLQDFLCMKIQIAQAKNEAC